MKTIQKLLIIVLALLVALIVWYFAGGKLEASAMSASAMASDYSDAYAAAAAIVRSGAAPQTFSSASLDSSEGYELVDATIRLNNRGLFAGEWLEISVNPGEGDVAVYSVSGASGDVPAFGSGQLNVKLITRDAGAQRSATVSYYVLGMRRSITVPLN